MHSYVYSSVYLTRFLSPVTSHFADLDFTPNFFKEKSQKNYQ